MVGSQGRLSERRLLPVASNSLKIYEEEFSSSSHTTSCNWLPGRPGSKEIIKYPTSCTFSKRQRTNHDHHSASTRRNSRRVARQGCCPGSRGPGRHTRQLWMRSVHQSHFECRSNACR